jgi:adenosine deaminase
MHELDSFIDDLPKAELHMHLEGSLEPELVLELARRNDVELPWASASELRRAYAFDDLQSFLNLYWAGCQTLRREQDFYDMTMAYLRRARSDNVLHAEVFLGMQNFTTRGIEVDTVMRGILGAFRDAASQLGMSAYLMVVAQRHRSEAEAYELLEQILPWANDIAAIGLGGPEVGYPPSGFVDFFRTCRKKGFRVVVHAGEEGPASYVREAFELLGADRIDHGNACQDDPALVRLIAERGTPLTLCPISNLRLNVIPTIGAHPLKRFMEAGVKATLNSDDPSYFSGYVNDNYKACRSAFQLTASDLATLARNSFASAFLGDSEKRRYLDLIDERIAR